MNTAPLTGPAMMEWTFDNEPDLLDLSDAISCHNFGIIHMRDCKRYLWIVTLNLSTLKFITKCSTDGIDFWARVEELDLPVYRLVWIRDLWKLRGPI